MKMAFYNQQPFLKPSTPFTGSIQGGLQDGKVITLTGRVLPGTGRFHVNLQCGSSPGADVALHFNPRFDSPPGYVVVNTFHHSKWGPEERKNEAPLPRGSNFTLSFLVKPKSFQILTNGRNFMEFKHRLNFPSVDTISVDGGVEIHCIAFQNPSPYPVQEACQAYIAPQQAFSAYAAPGQAYPSYGAPQPGYPSAPAFAAPPSYAVPYKTIINGGLFPGKNITIQGMVQPSATRFDINLRFLSGIALHFNPRFNENTVVRNSHLMQKWGSEERSGGMPFQRGQPFTVVIMCDSQSFKVIVNGSHAFTFKHRHSVLRDIDVFEVNGDVNLTSVVI